MSTRAEGERPGDDIITWMVGIDDAEIRADYDCDLAEKSRVREDGTREYAKHSWVWEEYAEGYEGYMKWWIANAESGLESGAASIRRRLEPIMHHYPDAEVRRLARELRERLPPLTTSCRFTRRIPVADLRRLEARGVRLTTLGQLWDHEPNVRGIYSNQAWDSLECLTDGNDAVWVWVKEDGCATGMLRTDRADAGRIVAAIREEFGSDAVEEEPEGE
jgi:hypothetical protein